MRMEFYRHLYMSESLEQRKASLIRKIKKRRISPGLYLIVLFLDGRSSLEFFRGILLRQHFFENRSFLVVGIADSYDDAVYFVQQIAEETYHATNGLEIREFIRNKQSQSEEGSVR